ncbi:MAG: DUF559 domain-containing protein [Balneolaceae bacterium]|nr:DUF559 domain-containing protein [Balneolaceae bacterium]
MKLTEVNPARFFIPDFYAHEFRLAIELDGKIHDLQKMYDQERDSILIQNQISVIRFKNEEVLRMDLLKRRLLEKVNQLRSTPSLRTE